MPHAIATCVCVWQHWEKPPLLLPLLLNFKVLHKHFTKFNDNSNKLALAAGSCCSPSGCDPLTHPLPECIGSHTPHTHTHTCTHRRTLAAWMLMWQLCLMCAPQIALMVASVYFELLFVSPLPPPWPLCLFCLILAFSLSVHVWKSFRLPVSW